MRDSTEYACAGDRSQWALRAGLALSGIGVPRLWTDYCALGGRLNASEVTAALHGERGLTPLEHDMLAQVLNEHFLDVGQDHLVPYSEEI
jgi:hypothetical protein